MRFLAVALVIFVSVFAFSFGMAEAKAGCHVRYVAKQEVAVAVATPVYVASYVPVAVAVPVYGVGYAAGAAAQEAAAELPRAQTCEEQLADLKARLYALETRQGGGGIGVNTKAPEVSVIVNRCSRCHDESVSKVKGKGVVLSRNNRDIDLTEALRLKCITEVVSGRMPKDEPLAEDDVTSILLQLSRPSATPLPAPVPAPAPAATTAPAPAPAK